MNRRVLLIDSDPAFRDTLTRELARYKVVVMTEANAERALTLANADAPALILLCIEEADKKAGFRVFEKCKKGALSKTPIILVTGSVPADSFAKHRNLKVHADEYIDKRTMSTHELVGKIDGLIALGDPEEEDLAIPIEDEIPMEIAEGDVVLDEVVGDLDDATEHPAMLAHEPEPLAPPEAHSEFEQGENEARTVGPNDGMTMDAVVEAETDAAFDALMGGFGEEPAPAPTPEAVAEQGEHRETSVAMPPVEPELSPVDAAVDEHVGVVPEPIIDGRGRGTTPPPLLAESVPGIIIDQAPMRDDHHGRTQALPRFQDAVPEAVPHQEPALPPLPEVEDEPLVADAMSTSIDVGALADAAEAEMPVAQHTDVYAAHDDVAEDDQGYGRMESQPAIAIDDDELVPLDDEVPVEVDDSEPAVVSSPVPQEVLPPVLPEEPVQSANSQRMARAGSNSHPAIDLGLDVVAQDAQSEQSGVYDRRALRKIGELERQIAQLKVELERARSAGETAAKGGRESQFLHLRESMLAKDKELKQVKTDLASRESEIAETGEKMRQAQARLASLEGKQAELEKRANEETLRAQKLTTTYAAAENQVTQLQQELATAQQTAQRAEAARQQLEKDLANERATGKASASESERLLRTEREQMVQRHASELATARTEGEAAKQAAIARTREELETAHGAALEQRTEELRRAHAADKDAAISAVEKQQAAAIVTLKADHAGEQSRQKSELGGQISQLQGELAAAKAAHEAAISGALGEATSTLEAAKAAHAAALAAATTEHAAALEAETKRRETELAKQRTEHAVALEENARAHAAKLAAAIAEKDKAHAAAAAAATADRDALIAAAAAEAEKAREELEAMHTEVFAAQDKTHADALAEQRKIFTASLAEKDAAAAEAARNHAEAIGARDLALDDLRIEASQTRKAHDNAMTAAREELAATIAKHEQSHGNLVEQHRSALAELTAKHEQELAKLTSDRDQIADAAKRAAEAHKTAVAEMEREHAAELSQVGESAGREVAEHKGAAAAARRAAEEALAKHNADREAADKEHAAALAEHEAKLERQLSIANGEFLKQKSVADAEHVKALAQANADAEKQRTDLAAEHARAMKDITSERDELKRGLSTARDNLKRSETELASAVQSIADRNADIRQHAAAIGERDQRLADLRKEIEALEAENASYQEQVLRAYQKIKTDEAMVARARKAMAIALTVLDDQGNPKEQT